MALLLPPNLNTSSRKLLTASFMGLPIQFGSPVSVCLQPDLTNCRGKLLSGHLHRGVPVHAASFIRQRRIVLETALLADHRLLRLICTHEYFHFVWPKLGNPLRNQFAALLQAEQKAHAQGELGESASVHKVLAQAAPSERRWRDYCCEAFCDTGAYLYGGVARCVDFTLATRWRARRRAWFERAIHWEARYF